MFVLNFFFESKLRKKYVFLVNYGWNSSVSLKTLSFFLSRRKKKKELIQINGANDNSWIEIMLFADGYLMTS